MRDGIGRGQKGSEIKTEDTIKDNGIKWSFI